MVAAFYTIVSLTQGSGLDLDSLDDKALFARVGAMYALVVIVGLIVRFERNRRRESVERERTLQRERSEISRTIHDNVAQTAYMIGLGIYQARRLADESNDELTSTLDATADLARAAMWELRRPLDSGQIYEGASLVVALESHVATFTTITSVPATVVTYGEEPELSTEIRSRLFSIAHNALTNAFRHSHAGKIEVELEYNSDSLRMSISDDGVGLPDNYAQRGYGFAGMRGDAEAVGGRFTVASGGSGGGTTVTCRVTF